MVLFAAITATREARSREFAVMRALGASGKLLGQVQRAELLGVGALAGVLASVAAMVVGWALAALGVRVRLGAGGVGASRRWRGRRRAGPLGAGWWGLREVLRRPVVETLRLAAQE